MGLVTFGRLALLMSATGSSLPVHSIGCHGRYQSPSDASSGAVTTKSFTSSAFLHLFVCVFPFSRTVAFGKVAACTRAHRLLLLASRRLSLIHVCALVHVRVRVCLLA